MGFKRSFKISPSYSIFVLKLGVAKCCQDASQKYLIEKHQKNLFCCCYRAGKVFHHPPSNQMQLSKYPYLGSQLRKQHLLRPAKMYQVGYCLQSMTCTLVPLPNTGIFFSHSLSMVQIISLRHIDFHLPPNPSYFVAVYNNCQWTHCQIKFASHISYVVVEKHRTEQILQ